ncbi:MAG: histidinol dehydrogenase, partial [Gemmatimonadaceae bacterium]
MTTTSAPPVISGERLRVRITGAVAELSNADRALLFERGTSADPVIRDRVAAIIARVRRDGDQALRALAHELDGARLETLEVPRAACRRALDQTDPRLRRAMERARDNISTAHQSWTPSAIEVETEPGIIVGRRPDPLPRVGVYAPGGRAAYPSSVLMG